MLYLNAFRYKSKKTCTYTVVNAGLFMATNNY